MTEIILTSRIKCPHCNFERDEEMPQDSCLRFYKCHNCGMLLKPKAEDCCVFCSYGSVPCPPIQEERLKK